MVPHSVCRNQFIGHDNRIYSNATLNQLGTVECRVFRGEILSKYPELASGLRAEYLFTAKKKSYVQANLRFLELDQQLQIRDFNLLSKLDETMEFACVQAKACGRIKASALSEDKAYSICFDLALSYRLTPPSLDDYNNEVGPCLNRLCCEKWWKRQLIKLQSENVESIARNLHQVHNHRTPYCSNIALMRRRRQKKNSREYLESQVAVNERDQEYTLAELSDLGVSNPSIRRMELITRCKGFEVVAKDFSHEGLFITLTTSSRFHRMTKITNGGKVVRVISNNRYENLSPRDAQNHLINLWGRIQAKLGREKIKPYGFRVAEPHHDGTPHWHFLLFVDRKQKDKLISIFRQWALQDSPEEKGAFEHRLKVQPIKTGINPSTGNEYSATGYLIKYICKNIDGHGVDNDCEPASQQDWAGKSPQVVAERTEAWARTYRIRQFQQIGGPSVTVWRELRRLSEQEGSLEEVRLAADAGDWAAFVSAMGGPTLKRKEYKVTPAYAVSRKLDRATGEINQVTHTIYGDEAKERIVGVLVAGITVLSRTHFWEIKENEKVHSARQKIMSGIVNLMDEIGEQNKCIPALHSQFLQRAKPAALDLFQ